jgi:hypothetical protein
MTIPYNVTTPQMIKYIQDQFELDEVNTSNTKELYYLKDSDEDIKLTFD